MPQRVTMTRQRPWRAEHPDAVIVARPSKWGNPFRIAGKRVLSGNGLELFSGSIGTPDAEVRAFAVRSFRWQLLNYPHLVGYTAAQVRHELAGRDLACWCPLVDAKGHRSPCHADVLLELANPGWTPPTPVDDVQESAQ